MSPVELVASPRRRCVYVPARRSPRQTIGAYRLDAGHSRILEVWLVPLDAALFDRIWSSGELDPL